jgi:hypothetical protein
MGPSSDGDRGEAAPFDEEVEEVRVHLELHVLDPAHESVERRSARRREEHDARPAERCVAHLLDPALRDRWDEPDVDRVADVDIARERARQVEADDRPRLEPEQAQEDAGPAVVGGLRLGQGARVRPAEVDPLLGLESGAIRRLYLAGAFASYIDIGNAVDIGFIPPIPAGRIEKVGNASLRGARIMLLSASRRVALDRLVGRIEHVELEMHPDFFDLFVEGCRFTPIAV